MSRIVLLLLPCIAMACTPADSGSSPDAGAAATVCGNDILETGEECDDGNPRNGDGCDNRCAIEERAICGNGVVEDEEECDDGNTADGDGCNAACFDEARLLCGNRQMDEGEECDDGNRDNGDGCDDHCQAEGEACGNRFRSPGGGETTAEECDDGNTEDGDGCSSSCACEEMAEDHANDQEGATALTIGGEPIAASLGCGDADVWSIQVEEDAVVRIYTESEIDTLCIIENDDGEAINGNDDADAQNGNYNCSVTHSFRAGETLWLRVRNYNADWGTGVYNLLTEVMPPDEYGDTIETATPIESLPYTAEAGIQWGMDVDILSYTTVEAGTITMSVTGELDPVCYILDAQGEVLAENDDIDTEGENYNCSVDYEAQAEQQLYFKAVPYTSERSPAGQPGPYTISISQQ